MTSLPVQEKLVRKRETGSVLLISMIFLIILTMVVLSMIGTGTLEERMAANDRNRQVGLHAAEAVIREAEALVLAMPAPFDKFDITRFTSNCKAATAGNPIGLCGPQAVGATPRWQTIAWDDATATRTFAAAGSNLTGVSAQPRYIIELVSAPTRPSSNVPCNFGLVNITARGLGLDDAAVFIQSTVRFQPNNC